jgi:hypothetical protein
VQERGLGGEPLGGERPRHLRATAPAVPAGSSAIADPPNPPPGHPRPERARGQRGVDRDVELGHETS